MLGNPRLPKRLRDLASASRLNLERVSPADLEALVAWVDDEIASLGRRGRLSAVRVKGSVRLRELLSRSPGLERPATPLAASRSYDLRITLLAAGAPVWRRVQTPDCSFDQLNEYIQAAFGWEGRRLHTFDIHGIKLGPSRCAGPFWYVVDEQEDEFDWTLSALLGPNPVGAIWRYDYGARSPWRHEIVCEGVTDAVSPVPECLDGALACPPEDMDSPWAYMRMLGLTTGGPLDQPDEEGVAYVRVGKEHPAPTNRVFSPQTPPVGRGFDRLASTAAMRRVVA